MKRIFIKKESRRSRFRGGAAAGTAESLIKSRQKPEPKPKTKPKDPLHPGNKGKLKKLM